MMTRRAAFSTAGASLLAAAGARGSVVSDPLTVETRHGLVGGYGNDGIGVFKGIPYGAPTETARFKPPQPPAPWTGVRDATAYGKMSPQLIAPRSSLYASWSTEKDMSEDCLVLNVWAPAPGSTAVGSNRPVMVWLHGGDFSSLSGSANVFDGTRLARQGDVVVVTLNHRLNIFGHLHLDQLAKEFEGSGNVGMLDIVAALRWVRDNIAAFGGNPNNVTIFGQSGGGAKVTTLMAMPQADGLFHKAIVQSGSYYLQAMSSDQATAQTRALLAALEIPEKSAAILATQPMDRLLSAMQKVTTGPEKANFRPVIDGKVLPGGPFAPGAPAPSARIPMMVGTTATEMSSLMAGGEPGLFDLDEAGLKARLAKWFVPTDIDRTIGRFRATRPLAKPADLLFAIATDKELREGAWRQAERKAAQHGGPVWLYELDWRTPVDGGKWGSPHSLCVPLVFNNIAMAESMVGIGPEAQAIAEQMSGAWVAFARTGNPNHRGLPLWPSYSLPARATMVFDTNPRMVNDFRGDERVFLAPLSTPAKS